MGRKRKGSLAVKAGLILGVIGTYYHQKDAKGIKAKAGRISEAISGFNLTQNKPTFQPEKAYFTAALTGGVVLHKAAVWGEVNRELPTGVNI